MAVNKVILVGNLGRDPEVRAFPSGGQVANTTLATTERWKDRATGEMREHTEWHRLVFNDRLAEIVAQYLRKGSQIYVEGSIRTRKWTDQSGQERTTTEIRVDQMQMLGSRNATASGGDDGGYDAPRRAAPAAAPARPAPAPRAAAPAPQPPADDLGDMDDDIPF